MSVATKGAGRRPFGCSPFSDRHLMIYGMRLCRLGPRIVQVSLRDDEVARAKVLR
jgi:hypothetical protein